MRDTESTWLLLLHHLPPKPLYLRAMVLRRLRKLGALPVKNSSYLLPDRPEFVEDLHWLRREIEAQGGAAWVFRTELVAGLDDAAVRDGFSKLHKTAYEELFRAASSLLGRARRLKEKSAPGTRAKLMADWKKLARTAEELDRAAFFGSPRKEEVDSIMTTLRHMLYKPSDSAPPSVDTRHLRSAVWVTRKGVKVDRIATAWLVRRFIGETCKFRFVDPASYMQKAGEIRFDMYEGEFTHQGDKCTFEVVLDTIGGDDAALRAIAEMVHDIDCKDDKFRRPETPGVAMMIDGIAARHDSDAKRLEDGFALFDSLYAQCGAATTKTPRAPSAGKR